MSHASIKQEITGIFEEVMDLEDVELADNTTANDIEEWDSLSHIRLIIGYNAKTQEVLYSDSWGMGHTLKRLPIADAWAMTFGLTVLKPRDVR